VQRGGTGPWIPATAGMKVYVNDAIKASGSVANAVQLEYYGNDSSTPVAAVKIAEGQVVLLPPGNAPNPYLRFSITPYSSTSQPGDIVYFDHYSSPSGGQSLAQMDVIMSTVAVVHVSDTQFEVIGNSTQATVYTFSGTVQLSDSAGTSTMTVGANQTATMAAGGPLSAPAAFDPTSINQWWSTATTKPSGTSGIVSSLEDLLGGNTLYLVLIAVVAVVVLGLLATRRRGGAKQEVRNGTTITQTVNVLPPPPPKAAAKDIKYCQACGTTNAISAKVCRSCGRKFSG